MGGAVLPQVGLLHVGEDLWRCFSSQMCLLKGQKRYRALFQWLVFWCSDYSRWVLWLCRVGLDVGSVREGEMFLKLEV